MLHLYACRLGTYRVWLCWWGLWWHAVAYQVSDVVMWVSDDDRISRKSGCYVRYAYSGTFTGRYKTMLQSANRCIKS